MLSLHMLQNALATLFGIGHSRWAPGTLGSAVALPFIALGQLFLDPFLYLVFSTVLFFIAVWSAEAFVQQTGDSDPQAVIIDEFVGIWIAATWLPFSFVGTLVIFVLFRFFDILKPWPISWFDRQKKGGLSVVADDVVAGIIVNVILQFAYSQGFLAWLIRI